MRFCLAVYPKLDKLRDVIAFLIVDLKRVPTFLSLNPPKR